MVVRDSCDWRSGKRRHRAEAASGCRTQQPKSDDAEGFISFRSPASDNDDSDASPCISVDCGSGISRLRASHAAPATASSEASLPLAVDLAASDPLLEVIEGFDGAFARWLAEPAIPPAVWAFGCGAGIAFAGRVGWCLRVRRLDSDLRPCILAGWLTLPAGTVGLPGPTSEHDRSLVVVVSDTGGQLVSSRASDAHPKLLGSSLLPCALVPGDLVHITADITRLRVWFRVNDGDCIEALRLPAPRRYSKGAHCRLLDTGYRPFFAVRGAAEVQALEGGAWSTPQAQKLSIGTGGEAAPEAVVLAGPPGAGKTAWALRHVAAQSLASKPVHILGAEWLLHRAAFASALELLLSTESGVCSLRRTEEILSASDGSHNNLHSHADDEDAVGRPATPARLVALLAALPNLGEDHYWVRGRGWNMEAIDDDIRIARGLGVPILTPWSESWSESWVGANGLWGDGRTTIQRNDREGAPSLSSSRVAATTATNIVDNGDVVGAIRTVARATLDRSSSAFTYVAPSANDRCTCLSLDSARRAIALAMPELLRRAALRSASVVADDCHLIATRRSAVRASLVRYPGRVRWVVVLPCTSAELIRRRSASVLRAPEERAGAELPGARGDGLNVEFAEGSDLSVFEAWRRDDLYVAVSEVRPELCSGGADRAERGHSVPGFFMAHGRGEELLSTEGAPRRP